MNELQLFQYQTKQVRTIVKDDQVWFVAKDVCDVLEIVNCSDAISGLDEGDEKGVATIDTLGGPQKMSILSEPGVYQLVIRSDKPEAKKFRKWVMHEVLPSIRKTGSYSLPPFYTFFMRATQNVQAVASDCFSVIEMTSMFLQRLFAGKYFVSMAEKAPDGKDICPDISVGLVFSKYLKENLSEDMQCYWYYSHKYPDGRVVPARQYPNRLLGVFSECLIKIWVPKHAPNYFKKRDPKIASILPQILEDMKNEQKLLQ